MERRKSLKRNSSPPAGLKLPILTNLVLLLATAAVLSLGVYRLSRQATSAIRFESRFVTAEWRLLAELKERTDRLLQSKDREIAFLRSRLLTLVRQGAPETERRTISSQLEQAYLEREEIMQRRINPPQRDLDQSSEVEGDDRGARTEAGGEQALSIPSAVELPEEMAQPEVLSPGENPTLAWYRRIIEDLTTGGARSASRRLENAPQGVGGLAERDRLTLAEIIDRAGEREELRARLSALDGELSRARSQEAQLRTLVASLEEEIAKREGAISNSREQGRETGEEEALTWSRLILDYLAGEEIESPEAARQRLITLWQAEEGYRELMVRAQRLGNAGISDGRDDLPSPVFVGYLRSVSGEAAEIEVLTDAPLTSGDSVEVRERSDIPPGRLIAAATAFERSGSRVRARIEPNPPGTPRVNDLVYVTRTN